MHLLGIGLNGAEKFCTFIDLPRPVYQKVYDTIVTNFHDAVKLVCEKILRNSASEEVKKTEEANQNAKSQINSRKNLTVSGDGNWRKRGFSSLFGVSCLIGYYSNKVSDIIVKSKFCKSCSDMEKHKGRL